MKKKSFGAETWNLPQLCINICSKQWNTEPEVIVVGTGSVATTLSFEHIYSKIIIIALCLNIKHLKLQQGAKAFDDGGSGR